MFKLFGSQALRLSGEQLDNEFDHQKGFCYYFKQFCQYMTV